MKLYFRGFTAFTCLGVSLFILLFVGTEAFSQSGDTKIHTVLKRLYTVKKYEQAIELCDKYLITHENKMPEGRLGLLFGMVLLKSNNKLDWIRASEALRWSYITDSSLQEEGLYYYSESLRKRGYWNEAVYTYKRFFNQYPRSVYVNEAKLKAADSMVKAELSTEAIKTLEELIDSPGFRSRAMLGLLKVYTEMQNFNSAASYLSDLSKENPQLIHLDDEALLAAAKVEYALERLEEARYYVDTLEKEYPASKTLLKAYLVMAEIMVKQKRIAEAEHYYIMAGASPENVPFAEFGIQKILFKKGIYEESWKKGISILDANPYFPHQKEVAYFTGLAFEAAGKFQESLPYFNDGDSTPDILRALLALHEKNPAAFLEVYPAYKGRMQGSMELGEVLLNEGRLKDARMIFKNNLLGKHQNRALKNLSRIYMAMGFEGLARDFLGDLIKRGVREDAVFRLYAELSQKLGRKKQALATLKRIRKKTGEDWLAIAFLYESIKQDKKAFAAYGKAISKGADEAYLYRAELQVRLGHSSKALPDYLKAMKASKKDEDRLWATYKAGLISDKLNLIKTAANWSQSLVSQVATELVSDNEFKKLYGRDRAIK